MNDEAELYLQRAENEFVAAQMLFDISSNPILQKEQFKLEKDFTFYSTVISHSYYCIFYSAKALFELSTDPEKHKLLGFTSFNGLLWVVNASYYSMFYMARALLENEGIKIKTDLSIHAVT